MPPMMTVLRRVSFARRLATASALLLFTGCPDAGSDGDGSGSATSGGSAGTQSGPGTGMGPGPGTADATDATSPSGPDTDGTSTPTDTTPPDTTATDTDDPPAECGNGVVEPGELCDGDDLDGLSCMTEGFDDGVLACAEDCMTVDTTGCGFVCQSQQFDATAIDWPLPGAQYGSDGDFPSLGGAGSCNSGEVDWAVTDLDGDGRLDLVITDDPACNGGPIGETEWLVHFGDGTGFAAAATPWSLPGAQYGSDGDFPSLGGAGSCNSGEVDWAVTDLTGDGLPDLVITDDPACNGGPIGEDEWIVHANTGTGFDPAGTPWALPGAQYGSDGDFPSLGGAGSCNSGEVDWAVTDLDGDALLDLVITDDPACNGGPIGETEWLVHFGDGTGFAAAATPWALPGAQYGSDGDFPSLGGAGSCNSGEVDWAVTDLTGDGLPDLVITDDPACNGGPIGEDEWLVHANTGTGFDPAGTPWALPGAQYGSDGDFPSLGGAGSCNSGEVDWAVTDLDGDALLDLVITDDPACNGGPIGETEWLVHFGDGTGFAAAASPWTLPGAQYGSDGDFPSLGGAGSCNSGEVDWAVTDLTGDGFLDLVITDDPACNGGPIGETIWRVHTGCQ